MVQCGVVSFGHFTCDKLSLSLCAPQFGLGLTSPPPVCPPPHRCPLSPPPQVQEDIARLPFAVIEGPDGGCLIKVRYCNEEAVFTPEQVGAGGGRW